MINLEPRSLEIVKAILARHVPQAEVLAFGSRVRGTPRPYSDLDLAIRSTKVLSIQEMGTLKEAFEASPLPIRVDLVDWYRTSPEFQDIIRAHGEKVEMITPQPPPMASNFSIREEI